MHTRWFLQRWRGKWIAAAVAALFLSPQQGLSWGFWGHKFMTRKAVQLLPEELQRAFVPLTESLSAHSIDPDLWRKTDPKEGNRHYIDLEMFGTFPFAELPFEYEKAIKIFGEDSVQKAGIAPWRIVEMMDSLSAAMRSKDRRLIVRYAAALAHYVEDIHMPLHTTINYNGQYTGNDGIHSRYERWMLEMHKKEIRAALKPRPAFLLKERLPTVFNWIFDSYVWVDNLLRADTRARVPGKRYEEKDDFDRQYYRRLFRETRSFTYLQMSRATTAVASCWYTAWERAGRPTLNPLN